MDAYEAREAYERANRTRALIIARDLRNRAGRLLHHARELEAVAREQTCFDPWEGLNEVLSPDPVVAVKDEEGTYHFLDPVELALNGVHELGDTSMLLEYVGSSADVTDAHLAQVKADCERADSLLEELRLPQ